MGEAKRKAGVNLRKIKEFIGGYEAQKRAISEFNRLRKERIYKYEGESFKFINKKRRFIFQSPEDKKSSK